MQLALLSWHRSVTSWTRKSHAPHATVAGGYRSVIPRREYRISITPHPRHGWSATRMAKYCRRPLPIYPVRISGWSSILNCRHCTRWTMMSVTGSCWSRRWQMATSIAFMWSIELNWSTMHSTWLGRVNRIMRSPCGWLSIWSESANICHGNLHLRISSAWRASSDRHRTTSSSRLVAFLYPLGTHLHHLP